MNFTKKSAPKSIRKTPSKNNKTKVEHKSKSKRFVNRVNKKEIFEIPTQQQIVLFNKPYDVLTQFTDSEGRKTLKDYIPIKSVYAAGRLDRDSEGLLILTNDGNLQNKITSPKHKMTKSYWVQVENVPNEEKLELLRKGIELKDGPTKPANVKIIEQPKYIWPRTPPIRERKNIPTTWLQLEIREGRNRQVRRMTAAIGHPTLRLIRYKIGNWSIDGIENGCYKVLQT